MKFDDIVHFAGGLQPRAIVRDDGRVADHPPRLAPRVSIVLYYYYHYYHYYYYYYYYYQASRPRVELAHISETGTRSIRHAGVARA